MRLHRLFFTRFDVLFGGAWCVVRARHCVANFPRASRTACDQMAGDEATTKNPIRPFSLANLGPDLVRHLGPVVRMADSVIHRIVMFFNCLRRGNDIRDIEIARDKI